jgi:prevent-host-death family protein
MATTVTRPKTAKPRKAFVPEQVNIYEAKTHLSALVERAANGEEIVIAKAGQPMAKLVPMPAPATQGERRIGGQNYLGITYMAPDWDAPMTEEELQDWGM